jgi:hypothetical protein
MALRRMKVDRQCVEFTRSGDRCALAAVDGSEVCRVHERAATKSKTPKVPLGPASSHREVLRRTKAALDGAWPEVVFELQRGSSGSGRDVLVVCWVDGPTVGEVHRVIAGLFSPLALGWGLPSGAPGVECSREVSAAVLAAALVGEIKNGAVEPPGKPIDPAWVRSLVKDALRNVNDVSFPEESLDGDLLEAGRSLVKRYPPGDVLMDWKWLTNVCVLGFATTT